VSTLQQLAFGLSEPIVSFFEIDPPGGRIVHLKADRRARAEFDHGSCESMGAGLQDHRLQPMLVTLLAGAHSGHTPIVHTGLEFVYCLDGTMEYEIEGSTYPLEAGDSLLFEAHLPHRWRNPKDDPTRVIMILSPSDEHDHASRRHFLLNQEEIRM
jgi:quercetin dioxygenase-like cupin family protein